MKTSTFLHCLLLVGAMVVVPCAHANLLQNGGFETGDFTDWNYTSTDNFSFVDTGFESEGTYAAWFGDLQADGGGTISQSISTVVGQKYTFSFDFAGDGDTPSGFDAYFGGSDVFSVTNPAYDANYVTQSFTVTATSTNTLVKFAAYDDDFYINLDNVSVTAQPAPEPCSMAMIGLCAAGLNKYRKSKKVQASK